MLDVLVVGVGLLEVAISVLAPPAANAPCMLSPLGPRGAGPFRASSPNVAAGRASPGQAGWPPRGSAEGSGSLGQRT